MTTLNFASWAQPATGAAEADIDPADGNPDNPPDPPARPSLIPAAVLHEEISNQSHDAGGPTRIDMLGPEGVVGLVPGQIVGRFPAPGSTGSEATNLAAAEFNTIDLPWRFSPARAGNANRLRPWLVLIVVPASIPITPGIPLPTMTVAVSQLPDLAESWAWAHVQLDPTIPNTGRSRLLCPRKLPPDTTLRAAIVPAFLGGVQAGLGKPIDGATVHAPAWVPGQPTDPVVLPVYDFWQFSTGTDADFEFLARRIRAARPQDLGEFGYRRVDINNAWIGQPLSGDPAVIDVGGALRPFGAPPSPTATPEQLSTFATRIAADIAASANGDLGPPLRGGRHVIRSTITTTGGDWLDEANRDPARRMVGGRAAEWVMANQEPLMGQAWTQAGQIREAGQRLAMSRAAAAITESLQSRHLDNLSTDELITVTAPAAGRARLGGAANEPTLRAAIAATWAPNGLHSTAMARLIRPAAAPGRATGPAILTRAIAGALTAATTSGYTTSTLASVTQASPPPTNPVAEVVAAASTDTAAVAATSLWVASRVAVNQGITIATTFTSVLPTTPTFIDGPTSFVPQLAASGLLANFALAITKDQLTTAPGVMTSPAAAPPIAIHPDGLQITASAVAGVVRSSFNPTAAVQRRLASSILRGDNQLATLDPVLPTPDVPIPMATAMIERDPEWFLPGIGAFPLDRATLLSTDNGFVESFLLGANVELLTKFLWREFPTDLRGTPIARFWPRPDNSPDIGPIHQWSGPLGTHTTLIDQQTQLTVILIRAELFLRYPNTVVLAAKAEVDPNPPHALRPSGSLASWLQPLFTLNIDPETRAVAFAVAPDAAGAAPPAEPGWFFVMIEPPTSLHFGFHLGNEPPAPAPPPPPPATWDQLTWDHVIDQRGFASARRAVTPTSPKPPPAPQQWGGPGACAHDVARIALQHPVRVALHGSTMVPAAG